MIRISFRHGRKHIKFIPTKDKDKEKEETENVKRLKAYLRGDNYTPSNFNLYISERRFK